MKKTKVAIACQGGGSQTAFTAGVLKSLSEANITDEFEFVSISGTSGGALCATLMWYALQRGERPTWQRMYDFWRDNTAQSPAERLSNKFLIDWMRLVNQGLLPIFQTSPSSPMMQAMSGYAPRGHRPEFSDFQALLKKHIDFDEIASWGPDRPGPALIIGAASVLSGRLRKFNSVKEVIRIEHILASAAVPNIFAAVEVDGDALWDGLFSDNPPIDDLVRKSAVGRDRLPNELWIIKINPTARATIPTKSDDILDRRNQLEGNVSMFQNLKWVEIINDMILAGAFKPEFLKEFDIPEPVKVPMVFDAHAKKSYHIPWIEMSPEVQSTLDYVGKIDRSPENLDLLLAHGEEQGRKFIEERAKVVGR